MQKPKYEVSILLYPCPAHFHFPPVCGRWCVVAAPRRRWTRTTLRARCWPWPAAAPPGIHDGPPLTLPLTPLQTMQQPTAPPHRPSTAWPPACSPSGPTGPSIRAGTLQPSRTRHLAHACSSARPRLLPGRACDEFVAGMRALPIGADADPATSAALNDALLRAHRLAGGGRARAGAGRGVLRAPGATGAFRPGSSSASAHASWTICRSRTSFTTCSATCPC